MPTYQYACTACGHRFEAVQSFHDDALTHCPECDGRLRKVFNAVGVVFKGSGFYRNDSRSTSSTDSGSSEGGSKEAAAAGAAKDSGATKPGAKDSGSSTKESTSAGADTKSSASSTSTATSSTPS